MQPNKPIITRDDAQVRGLKRFYTGKPCARNHLAERFTSNGTCVECQNRSTPARHRGPDARNVGWPRQGVVFQVQPHPTPEEIEAAFVMFERYGWQDECVRRLRDGRAKLEEFLAPLPITEVARLHAELARAERVRAALYARLVPSQADPAAVVANMSNPGGRIDREEPEFEGGTTLRAPDADEPPIL